MLEIYLDDFILHKIELNHHVEEAGKLFDQMEKCNIKCAMNKSEMLIIEVTFLGNTITKNKIYPNKKRADCLTKRPKPVTLKELQAWLGASNYLRRYIKEYAEITKSLYDAMDLKNVPKALRKRNGALNGNKVYIEWTVEAANGFEKLKEILGSELVLELPDFDREMVITTDASDNGYGAVLEQNFRTDNETEDKFKPVEYYSKSYTPAQKNYSTTEKELLAVVMAVEKIHHLHRPLAKYSCIEQNETTSKSRTMNDEVIII